MVSSVPPLYPLPFLTLLTLVRLAPAWAGTLSPEPPPPPPPTGWVVDRADVTVHLRPAGDGPAVDPTVDLTYTFRRIGTTWSTIRLVDNVLPRHASGPLQAFPSGAYLTLDPSQISVSTTLSGVLVAAAPDRAVLHLPPAARAYLHIDAPGLDVVAAGSLPAGAAVRAGAAVTDRVIPANGTLDLTWQPHVDRAPDAVGEGVAVVRAEVSTASWPRDGALNLRSRVRFVVTRGEATSFSLDVGGLQEVEVVGPVEHTLVGSTLTLTAPAPVSGILTVEVTGRRAAVSGPFPSPTPLGVSRVESWFTLGKPDEGDVVPSGGVTVSARQLPAWARGLSEATPVAYWSSAPTLAAGSFETVMGPDTIVQSAEYVVSQSEDGHVLARATWLVRNERSQYLKVTPPKGYRPLTARVSGRPALLLREGADFYVPLEKSIETVQGLLAFPVEVAWIGDDGVWLGSSDGGRHHDRVLELPAVNAPIQAASWEVHLPRGWKVDEKGGSGRARAVAPVESVLDPAKEQAREAWTNAIDAYKKNDFGDAQRWLDASRGYADQTVAPDAATMDNVGRLQSNLDVLLPKEAKADDVLARRVRDLANAKTTDAQLSQSRLEETARKALLVGDDEKATAALEEVTRLAEDIGVTQQKESNEQSDKVAEYEQTINDAKARVEKKKGKASYDSNDTDANPDSGYGAKAASAGKASSSLGSLGISGKGEGGGGYGSGNSMGTGGGFGSGSEAVVGGDWGIEGELEEGLVGGVSGGTVGGVIGGQVGQRGEADANGDDLSWREQSVDESELESDDDDRHRDMGGRGKPAASGERTTRESLNALGYAESEPAEPPQKAFKSEPAKRDRDGESQQAAAPVVAARPSPASPPARSVSEVMPPPPPPRPPPSPQPPPVAASPSPRPTAEAASDGWADQDKDQVADKPADAVTGTFSTNFNYEAVEQIEVSAPEIADAEVQTVVTQDFLSRIPTGRSYQSAVGSVAGVVAQDPPPSSGSSAAPPAFPRMNAPASSPQADLPPPRPVPSHVVVSKVGPQQQSVPDGGDQGYLNAPGPTWDGERYWGQEPPSPSMSGRSSSRPSSGLLQAAAVEKQQKAEMKVESDRARYENKRGIEASRQAQKVAQHQQQSRTKANGNNGPDTRERRNPLEVSASPLTPALPLDGPLLTHSAALLDAGEFPSFEYTVSPDPKSVHLKE